MACARAAAALTAALFAALSAICGGGRAADVPFNASIVGEAFVGFQACLARVSRSVVVQADAVAVTARFADCAGCERYTQTLVCDERLELRFRRRPAHPFILAFAQTLHKRAVSARGACQRRIPVEYHPWGKSRMQFSVALRRIVAAAKFVREDKSCDRSNPGPGPAGFIVDYLLTVAYDYDIEVQ